MTNWALEADGVTVASGRVARWGSALLVLAPTFTIEALTR